MQILDFRIEANLIFDEQNIETFLVYCEEVISNITPNEESYFKLKSAIHELLVNSLEHGYQKGSGKVCLSIKRKDNAICLEICDEGIGIDISNTCFDNIPSNIENIKGRGWGLLILKKITDDMKITSNTPKGTKVSLTVNL